MGGRVRSPRAVSTCRCRLADEEAYPSHAYASHWPRPFLSVGCGFDGTPGGVSRACPVMERVGSNGSRRERGFVLGLCFEIPRDILEESHVRQHPVPTTVRKTASRSKGDGWSEAPPVADQREWEIVVRKERQETAPEERRRRTRVSARESARPLPIHWFCRAGCMRGPGPNGRQS